MAQITVYIDYLFVHLTIIFPLDVSLFHGSAVVLERKGRRPCLGEGLGGENLSNSCIHNRFVDEQSLKESQGFCS